MKILTVIKAVIALALPLLASCGGRSKGHSDATGGNSVPMDYAEFLNLTEHPGYTLAEIHNPWDTTETLHRYVLVPDSAELPEKLPEGSLIRTPLKNSLVYSTVHTSLISELGASDAVKGVCDAEYIRHEPLASRIRCGAVADCGNSTSPNIEKIISMNPDGILLSPFENSGTYGKLGELGIPLIECADYMESSPLGRAEWMKFYGLLFGNATVAYEMYARTKKEYEALRESAKGFADRPKVLVDRLYGAAWYVPGGESTMGTLIKDAGGVNPFAEAAKNGSAPLTGEQVLHQAGDADVWIIRYSQERDMTLKDLEADNPLYGQFKALREGNVFGCNTSKVGIYNELAFHPQWCLADLIRVFHPEVEQDALEHRYFTRLDQ